VSDLRDPLDDLLAEIPAYVVPDARAAWAAGARRRSGRRVGVAAVAVVALALVAGLASVLPSANDAQPATGSGDLGYPAHVDKPWFLHDLPDRPGPVSAVVASDGAWLAAAPDGRAWRIPQEGLDGIYPPALSDDGRMLAYLSGPSTYVLRDLLTGAEQTFDDVTEFDDSQARPGAFGVAESTPAYWSPDGTRLVLAGSKWVGGVHVHGLVLGTDGTTTEVKDIPRYPVGWLDDDTLTWLDGNRLVETDQTGGVEATVRLHLDPTGLDGWSTALSPDRTRVAVVLPGTDSGRIVTLSTADGRVQEQDSAGAPGFCSPAWAGDEPAFFRDHALDTTAGQRTIVVDPALQANCILVAAQALDGPRHERFGDRTFGDGWLSWHWQEVGLGLLLAVLLVVGGLLLLSARSRRRSA
jgi:hypothetical protein